MDYYYYEGDYSSDEDYAEEHLHDYIDGSYNNGPQTLAQAYEVCIKPSVRQIFGYILIVVGWSLVFRVVCLIVTPRIEWLKHLLAMLCGIAALYFTLGWELLIIMLLAILAYVLILCLEYHQIKQLGLLVSISTIGLHFAYELCWNTPESWQRLRGIQMISSMKIISLAYDIEHSRNKKQVPGIIPYLGYILSPASCVLGPWMPYSSYVQSLHGNNLSKRWIFTILLNVMAAIVFLTVSNCLAPMLFSASSWQWLQTYRDALSVRTSHYFVCFLSQAAISAGNIGHHTKTQSNALFGTMVTKPWHIEFPRSLNYMVRNWNIPMHNWLKTYVFQATLKRSKRYFFAILFTYLVSSLLHGLHYRIYLILLSLAMFAYIESVLRLKLAQIFNACIAANPCSSSPCSYVHCLSHGVSIGSFIVLLVNFLFSIVCSLHLAYLGIMLTTNGIENDDISLGLGLKRWSYLNYLSHWVALGTFIFYRII